jgi:hypothetical protein
MAPHPHDRLVAELLALSFHERASIAQRAGLTLFCCPGCGCYVGSPECHPVEDAVEWQAYGECAGHDEDGPCVHCVTCGDSVDTESPWANACTSCGGVLTAEEAAGG